MRKTVSDVYLKLDPLRFPMVLMRRVVFQETGMLIIPGEQCFDFRPQPGVIRAGLIEECGPGLRVKLTRSKE